MSSKLNAMIAIATSLFAASSTAHAAVGIEVCGDNIGPTYTCTTTPLPISKNQTFDVSFDAYIRGVVGSARPLQWYVFTGAGNILYSGSSTGFVIKYFNSPSNYVLRAKVYAVPESVPKGKTFVATAGMRGY